MPPRDELLLVSLLVAALALLGAGGSHARGFQGAVSLESRVDALFATEIRPDGPGCAVGVYRNGGVVLTRAFGVANVEDGRAITPRTTFNLGSLSKPFTALSVLILEQRGRLSLDDDVRRWVPELPRYEHAIRVRDLLQHTSGLRDFQSLEVLSGRAVSTASGFLDLVAGQSALNFTPGTRHEYSHTDFGLLGLIAQRAAGQPFGEYLRREVLEPMGMMRSFVDDSGSWSTIDRAFGHVVSPQGPRVRYPGSQTFGGDNLYSSVEDLAHWDRNFDQPAVGGHAVIKRMLDRPKLSTGETIPYAYGLRLGTYRGLRTVSRGGHDPGTRTEVIRFPDQQLTVATLCNADQLEAWRFAQGVADLYLGHLMSPLRLRPTPPAGVAMSVDELARYAGVYRRRDDPWDLGPIEVRKGVLGEVVFDELADEVFYPMTPAGSGRFFEIGRTGNVGILAFRTPAPGAPLLLEISWNDGPADVLERMDDLAVWRPAASTLSEYAGVWFSPDLDAGWRLDVREGKLVLVRRGQPDATLRPVERDRFVRGLGPDGALSVRLQFHRDRDRRLTHLTVSTPPGEDSVRDLRFTRPTK